MKSNVLELDEAEISNGPEGIQDSDDHQQIDESTLVQRAQAGDEKAFSSLLRPYTHLAYHVALRITGNREDAEDASQQSLLKAYTHIGQFQGDSQFSTWLTRIAINEALMKLRKRRSEKLWFSSMDESEEEQNPIETLPAGDDMHPEALYMKWENSRRVRRSIEGLRGITRAVVWMLVMQERKIKETARLLQLSESAVKSRIMRARQQLRESLADCV
ncbi:MAG TPA: sigma-70 family RNA polymerase sigma factor [Candidatus Acidoferrales bacterium]